MTITAQTLADAEVDVATIDSVTNGDAAPGVVYPRRGNPIRTLRRLLADIVAAPPSGWLSAFAGLNLTYNNKGDPGGNVMAIGTFAQATATAVPVATNRIKVADRGGAEFVDVTGVTLAASGQGKWWFTTNGGARTWRLDPADSTSYNYGAVGDRNTDDGPALQAALDDLATRDQYPGQLTLDPGHYHRTQTLTIKGFGVIEGRGPGTVLNSQNKDFPYPILTNSDPYGMIGLRLRKLQFYGGTHGVYLKANSENADLVFTEVSMGLQTVANIEANKLLQTTYFFGGTYSTAPYGIRSDSFTANVVVSFGQQLTDHAVSALRFRTTQGVAFYGSRFEARGSPHPIRLNDASMAAGSTTLTTGATLGQQYVGRLIVVQQAVTAGEPLRTAITAVSADGHTLTLYDPAVVAVSNVIADIDRVFGATLDLEDVNGPFLISGAYFEAGQQYLLRLRRGRNVAFESCHFTGQQATTPGTFSPYEWDTDDSVVTFKNCHSNLPMTTTRHTRMEGDNVNIAPLHAYYWGTDWHGGCATKSGRPGGQTVNILQFNRVNLDGGSSNVAQLMGTLKLNYIGYNSNGTALRRLVAYYDVRVVALLGGSNMILEIAEQAGRRFDQMAGGTVTLSTGVGTLSSVIAVSFNFDPSAEASSDFSYSMEWGPNSETAATDRIVVKVP